MARSKLKPPTRSGRRRSGNFGWYAALAVIVVLGIAAIVASREGGGAGTGVVSEVTAPDLGAGEAVSVTTVAYEAYDRVEDGSVLFELSAGDRTEEVRSPHDGFFVGAAVEEGTEVEPGAILGRVQTGPDFAGDNPTGNHWHTAYGVNVCGSWLPPVGQTSGDFHSHGDGLVHAHPRSSSAAGDQATIGLWFQRQGGSVSEDEVSYPGGDTYTSGEVDCGGDQGVLRWALNGEEREGDPGDVVVGNGTVLTIAFVPEDAELPTVPPSASHMAQNYAEPNHPDVSAPGGGAPPTGEPAGDGGGTTGTGTGGGGTGGTGTGGGTEGTGTGEGDGPAG